jgi:hypothetical protein
MAMPPFVVRVQSLLMPVAVIAGIAAARDRTGVVPPAKVIDAGADIVRKAQPGQKKRSENNRYHRPFHQPKPPFPAELDSVGIFLLMKKAEQPPPLGESRHAERDRAEA